ncbi:aldehyde dehydrogenase family protein [Actibacterium pelagium]|uniref:Salicylaldehyde dehydrogenase n=1 Tax=Actibacterium pelagium TaxID=2029103 RepID=A0A917EJF8_9RHOB|nr:aldehyde dehydrogenase family protein [Actibacterium pelagium]GGE43145.1 salicylaldehyde dehydrogenase [Actibacterium pelagium]
MYEAQLIVGGKKVDARDKSTYQLMSSTLEGPSTVAAAATVRDAKNAANAAAAAFPAWSVTPDEERAAVLSKAADTIEARADDFVAVMASETGSTEAWARFNCKIAANVLRHAASQCGYERHVVREGGDPHVSSYLVRQPAGVVLGIAPWNAPIVLATRAVAIPLAVGNTVVLKASERCPKTHSMVIEAINEAGAVPGAANLVTNAPDLASEVTEAIIAHAAVRRVNFTGSTRVGRHVAETCARHLKPVVLELSGKAGVIVLNDADTDRAVNAAVFGAFFNQGQICMSTERVIIDDQLADDFAEKLVQRTSELSVGDPNTQRVNVGPMISADAAIRAGNLIEDAVSKGAQLLTGGAISKSTMEPAVLDHVDSSMRIYHEESFGPVLSIIRVRSEDEAITVANDTDYALAASVFSEDIARAQKVAAQLECGVCQINGPTVYDDPRMPFGGLRASGYGKLGGVESIDEFTELRWIGIHEKEGEHFL